ncbi:MAG: hypothetical protein ACRC8Y_11020 [Chroococcales cyanobacterium]
MAKPYHAIAGFGLYRKVILGNGLLEETTEFVTTNRKRICASCL